MRYSSTGNAGYTSSTERRGPLATLSIVTLLVGCGSGGGPGSGTSSGLEGMYQTAAHYESRPCDAAGEPLAAEPAYFRLYDEQLVNGLFVSGYNCTGPDPTTCDEQGFPFLFLAARFADGEFLAESVSRSGDPCLVGWTGVWARKSDRGVNVTEEYRSAEWTGAACTGSLTDAQVRMGRSFTCVVAETWEGSKL